MWLAPTWKPFRTAFGVYVGYQSEHFNNISPGGHDAFLRTAEEVATDRVLDTGRGVGLLANREHFST